MRVTATTHVAGVIGHPIRHSLSPAIHNAAFAALDLDWAFVAFDVAPGCAREAVVGARLLGVEGLSVTMPHKEDVIDALDRVTPVAERLRAVNAIHRVRDEWVGESTDGAGFIDALRHDEGVDVRGLHCVVVGAGGAARAVILALTEAGAESVTVVNRTPARAAEAAALGGVVGDAGAIAVADVVVNATSVGMAGVHEGELPLDASLLHAGQVVVDLVYHPLRTPLLEVARDVGAVAVTGLGMLIHQAAHAFRLWTGEDPPLEAMSAAAVSALTSPAGH